jgi:hypothetical protein
MRSSTPSPQSAQEAAFQQTCAAVLLSSLHGEILQRSSSTLDAWNAMTGSTRHD